MTVSTTKNPSLWMMKMTLSKGGYVFQNIIKILFLSNEKDFEVAQVAMISLRLNSREVSIQLLMLWGPCSLSSLSAVVVRPVLNLKGSRSKNKNRVDFQSTGANPSMVTTTGEGLRPKNQPAFRRFLIRSRWPIYQMMFVTNRNRWNFPAQEEEAGFYLFRVYGCV